MFTNKIPMKTKKDQIIQIIQESMMLKAGVPNNKAFKNMKKNQTEQKQKQKKNPQSYLLVN